MTTRTVLHGIDQSGTTAQRPSNAPEGFVFFDTTLDIPLIRDEANSKWLDLVGRDITPGILSMSGAGYPTDGTSGTGAGVAAPGCLYQDTTNGLLFINTNTKASPLWTVVGTQVATT